VRLANPSDLNVVKSTAPWNRPVAQQPLGWISGVEKVMGFESGSAAAFDPVPLQGLSASRYGHASKPYTPDTAPYGLWVVVRADSIADAKSSLRTAGGVVATAAWPLS
jgi:hypothetical protein